MVSFVFRRYEYKYRLTQAQYRVLRAEMQQRLQPDAYGETTVQSLYYDTPVFRLARASIEKPEYKEKLRLRCYGRNDGEKDVFLEMKRKAEGLVYKRRVICREERVPALLAGQTDDSQIGRELAYFLSFYGELVPKIMLLYDREAFFDPSGDLRVTFDRNIRFRTDSLFTGAPLTGEPLPDTPDVLLEIKTARAIPLWLCQLLSREEIYLSTFSKYGVAYQALATLHKENTTHDFI